jgi:4-hydroxy-3-methylbut-2-enyl diphosphate reductase
MIVVGGSQSNNTRELAETCRKQCSRVHQIETASDLRSEWFVHVETAGLTAGTSTPDDVIAAVETRMRKIASEHESIAIAK